MQPGWQGKPPIQQNYFKGLSKNNKGRLLCWHGHPHPHLHILHTVRLEDIESNVIKANKPHSLRQTSGTKGKTNQPANHEGR